MPSADVRTILVVEDEADVRDYLAASLQAAGYRVLEGASVQEALAMLRAGKSVDAILADYNLPDGTGAELIHQVGNEGLFDAAHHPAVICTAYRYVELPPHVVMLHKPIDPAELVRIMAALFGSERVA